MSENRLTSFTLDGKPALVNYIETQAVKEGVECDVYAFTDDSARDLAIVRVAKGFKTPLQKVLLGEKTIEGYLDGSGSLTIHSVDGQTNKHQFNPTNTATSKEVTVEVGQIMQWHADGSNDLTFYEICEPPYNDGRFENLNETE